MIVPIQLLIPDFITELVVISFIADHIVVLFIVEHVVIFFIILKRAVLYSFEFKKLNIFHFVLLLFEISAISRFMVVIGNLKTGDIYFYLTVAFGVLIGIFFLFYNENNSPKISLESKSIIDME
jgi:hypothetical protein